MSRGTDDPRCPECGDPIGATATYCMHCSADLTQQRARDDADGDGYWDVQTGPSGAARETAWGTERGRSELDGDASPVADSGSWLDPSGIVDDTLTVVVGIAGGLVVGVVGTGSLLLITANDWAVLGGAVAWIASTAHLVRQPTIVEAVQRTAYATAAVLLLVPLIAFGPTTTETDLGVRFVLFATMLGGLAVPAALLAGIGLALGHFWPQSKG